MISSGKEHRNRVNGDIRSPSLRLIDQTGKQVGVVTLEEARKAAAAVNMDLVEIQPNASPPVAKIMDHGKFVFRQKKQQAEAKKKQRQVKVKEIKFRPSTDVGDYEVKLRNLRGFLAAGDKVKVTVWFRGREMSHQELGVQLLERIREDLAECSKVEFFPKLEGRHMIMILAPKKSGKA